MIKRPVCNRLSRTVEHTSENIDDFYKRRSAGPFFGTGKIFYAKVEKYFFQK
jgi:hypothetical protein